MVKNFNKTALKTKDHRQYFLISHSGGKKTLVQKPIFSVTLNFDKTLCQALGFQEPVACGY